MVHHCFFTFHNFHDVSSGFQVFNHSSSLIRQFSSFSIISMMFQIFPECTEEGFSFRGWRSAGLGVDAKFVRSVRVRKRPQASTSVRKRPRPKIVAKRRTVVTVGLALRSRVSKVSTVSGIGGPGREAQNCRHFWIAVGSPRFKRVNSHRDRGSVVVAKRRAVVAFGLALRLRVSKVSTVRGTGGPGRDAQSCRCFWPCVASSRLNSVNSLRDRGGPGRETQNCRHF